MTTTLAPIEIPHPDPGYDFARSTISNHVSNLLAAAAGRETPVVERHRQAIYLARFLAAKTPFAADYGLIADIAANARIPHLEVNNEHHDLWHPRLASAVGQFRKAVGGNALLATVVFGRNVNSLTPDAYDVDRRRIFRSVVEQAGVVLEDTPTITEEGYPIMVVDGREQAIELLPNRPAYERTGVESPYTLLDFPKK